MSAHIRPYAQIDLAAIVLKETFWRVEDDGATSAFRANGGFRNLEQYCCMNCGECFGPEDTDSNQDWARAWQAALAYLGGKGVA
jgi:hypothetical protein